MDINQIHIFPIKSLYVLRNKLHFRSPYDKRLYHGQLLRILVYERCLLNKQYMHFEIKSNFWMCMIRINDLWYQGIYLCPTLFSIVLCFGQYINTSSIIHEARNKLDQFSQLIYLLSWERMYTQKPKYTWPDNGNWKYWIWSYLKGVEYP